MDPTTCPQPKELGLLVKGQLSAEDAESMQRHVEACADCAARVRSMQTGTDAVDIGHHSLDTVAPSATSPTLPSSGSFLSPPLEADEIGRLAHYRVLRELGSGGMGKVYEAEDIHLQRRVALKVLRPEMIADTSYRQRFLQEARTAASTNHDHIVTIYQVGQQNDVPFLAMQLLDGKPLEDLLIEKGKLPAEEVVRIGREIAEGLAAAHERGLIHRDIKPANIFLEKLDGTRSRSKILDFGLARPTKSTSRLTQTGLVMGTPGYMSPEQARGLSLTPTSDLFSLGAVMYHLLSGYMPFDGPDTMAVLTALAVEDPPDLRRRAPNAPPALVDLINQLLAKKPEGRPKSARDVVEALQRIEGGQHQPMRPKGNLLGWIGAAAAALILIVAVGYGAVLLSHSVMTPKPTGPTGPPIKIGILHSQTGTMATSERAVAEATQLAIDEINEAGGVLDRPLEAVMADGQSDWDTFAREAERLIRDEKVEVVFGCWTSASRKTVKPIFERYDHLLFYPVQYEGLEMSPNIIYTGAAPNQQLLPGVNYGIRNLKRKRLFIVGSDYVFPRTAAEIVRDTVKNEEGVAIVGEVYMSIGNRPMGKVIESILDAKPDLIINLINGDESNRLFFRALRMAGIQSSEVPTISFSIGENELQAFSPADRTHLVGDYAAWNYFQCIKSPANRKFVQQFKARHGEERVTSDPMEAGYFGVHLWALAAAAAKDTSPKAVRTALKNLSYDAPEGEIKIDADSQHTWKVVRVGQIIENGQFDIVHSLETAIKPEPYPPTRTREQWDAYLKKLYEGWGKSWEKP